jgi:hypothetical protein
VDKSTGVGSDQTVILTSFESASVYPDALRRVSYFDEAATKLSSHILGGYTQRPDPSRKSDC